MEIGVGLDHSLGLSFEQHRELAQEAARLGYTSLWTPAGIAEDAYHICVQWSQASAQVMEGGLATGIAVVPVPIWSAPALAATAGTVGVLTGGRFVLGIGTGLIYSEAYRRTFGLPTYPPVAMMRDYLTAVRGLLAGDRITHEGTAIALRGVQLGFRPPPVPVYLAALGPQMLRLAGEAADGVALNWCTPAQVAWSRRRLIEGAQRAGRNPSQVRVSEYIRICVDEDEDLARRALARALLPYAMARPGADNSLGYRGHFARMGFDEALTNLEARRDRGAPEAELVDSFPSGLLSRVGYSGPPTGAAAAFHRLAEGLDTAIVRVVAARPGVEPVLATMRACRPAR